MITYCDINTCEECPRYGDDCDGDKRVEHTDLISRTDAIEAIASASEEPNYQHEGEDWMDGLCQAEQIIDALPSAEAVQGEWIHDGQNFKGGLDWCHCSECGCKTSANGLSMYNYCPNCGARMKGGA